MKTITAALLLSAFTALAQFQPPIVHSYWTTNTAPTNPPGSYSFTGSVGASNLMVGPAIDPGTQITISNTLPLDPSTISSIQAWWRGADYYAVQDLGHIVDRIHGLILTSSSIGNKVTNNAFGQYSGLYLYRSPLRLNTLSNAQPFVIATYLYIVPGSQNQWFDSGYGVSSPRLQINSGISSDAVTMAGTMSANGDVTKPALWEFVFNGASSMIRSNGVTLTTGSTTVPMCGFTHGGTFGSSSSQIVMGDVLVFTNVLSGVDENVLSNYFYVKYSSAQKVYVNAPVVAPAYYGDGSHLTNLHSTGGTAVAAGANVSAVTNAGLVTLSADVSTNDVKAVTNTTAIVRAGVSNNIVGHISIEDTNQFVGIGTTSPLTKLAVVSSNTSETPFVFFSPTPQQNSGAISIEGNGNAWLAARDNASGHEFAAGISVASGNPAFVGSLSGTDLQLRTSNTTRVTINGTNGNVGIGTNNPTALLDLVGSSSSTSFRMAPSGFKSYAIVFGASLPAWVDATSPNARIDSVGDFVFNSGNSSSAGNYFNYDCRTNGANYFEGACFFNKFNPKQTNVFYGVVGIGTTSPRTNLDVSGSVIANNYIGSGSGLSNVVAASSASIATNTASGQNIDAALATKVGTGAVQVASLLVGGGSPSEQVTIAGYGSIGMTSGNSLGYLSHVYGSDDSRDYVSLSSNFRRTNGSGGYWGNTSMSSAEICIFQRGNSNGIVFSTTGSQLQVPTERMRITSSGAVGINTDSPRSALEVNGTVIATNFVGSGFGLSNVVAFLIPTSSIPFTVTSTNGVWWNSNSCLYWVTATKTNLVSDGR